MSINLRTSLMPRTVEENIDYPNSPRRFPSFFELKQRRLKAEAAIQAAESRIQAAEERFQNAIAQVEAEVAARAVAEERAQTEATARAAAEERVRLLEEQLRQHSSR